MSVPPPAPCNPTSPNPFPPVLTCLIFSFPLSPSSSLSQGVSCSETHKHSCEGNSPSPAAGTLSPLPSGIPFDPLHRTEKKLFLVLCFTFTLSCSSTAHAVTPGPSPHCPRGLPQLLPALLIPRIFVPQMVPDSSKIFCLPKHSIHSNISFLFSLMVSKSVFT